MKRYLVTKFIVAMVIIIASLSVACRKEEPTVGANEIQGKECRFILYAENGAVLKEYVVKGDNSYYDSSSLTIRNSENEIVAQTNQKWIMEMVVSQ